jgi:hypothetical protein
MSSRPKTVAAPAAMLLMLSCLLSGSMPAVMGPASCHAQAVAEGRETRAFAIAGGSYTLEAPEGWKQVPPKSRIVESEFAVPSEGEGLQPGRMTVMGAGGSVQANVDRWIGQFVQPDGSPTKDKATTKSIKLAECSVTLVDISGTFKDMPAGPFGGGAAVDRPDYRMLAAIVETPGDGSYFLKFYGPSATVAKHADGFRRMVEGMVAAPR